MKKYLLRKKIFAVVFLMLLAYLSVTNWKSNFLKLKESLPQKKQDYFSKDAVSSLEDTINENLLHKMSFIEGYAYTQYLMGKHEINNFDIIKDRWGYLHYSSFYQEDTTPTEELALRVRRLNDLVVNQSGKFLLVLPPSKYVTGITPIEEGMKVNDPNPLMDELLFYSNQLKVPSLDYRIYFPKTAKEYKDSFFKTDHHWTIPASFEAFQILIDTMNQQWNAGLDEEGEYRDPENYTGVNLKNRLLGSMGRRTSNGFVPLEDFTFLYPKEQGNYIMEDISLDGEKEKKSGGFNESILNLDVFRETDLYRQSYYDVYLGGLGKYQHIENKNGEGKPNILIIRDSYFNPVSAFMAPLFREMDILYNLEAKGEYSVESMIKKKHYDYVIFEVYPYNIGEDAFLFFNS